MKLKGKKPNGDFEVVVQDGKVVLKMSLDDGLSASVALTPEAAKFIAAKIEVAAAKLQMKEVWGELP